MRLVIACFSIVDPYFSFLLISGRHMWSYELLRELKDASVSDSNAAKSESTIHRFLIDLALTC